MRYNKSRALEQLRDDYGNFVYNGEEYIFIEEVYLTNGVLYGETAEVWESHVVKTSDKVEDIFGSPCLPLYEVIWEPNNDDPEGFPLDWDEPYNIKNYSVFDLETMSEV